MTAGGVGMTVPLLAVVLPVPPRAVSEPVVLPTSPEVVRSLVVDPVIWLVNGGVLTGMLLVALVPGAVTPPTVLPLEADADAPAVRFA